LTSRPPPNSSKAALDELNFAFFFAPNYHPAFKHIAPVRKALAARGQRSVFNILGPLINPGRPAHILLGVFSDAWVPQAWRPPWKTARDGVGPGRAWRDRGPGRGIDELTTATRNRVRGLGRLRDQDGVWSAADFGLPVAPFADLLGGDVAANLALTDAILDGQAAPAGLADTMVLNAAVGLWICGRVPDVRSGLAQAKELLLGGAVRAKIAATKEFFRLMNRRYFGTDGVRGTLWRSAHQRGVSPPGWARRRAPGSGRSTRMRASPCSSAATPAPRARTCMRPWRKGLRRRPDLTPVSLGVVPTPAVARAVVRKAVRLGVVITASHNPAADNGIKFFGPGGVKLTDEDEAAIESLLGEAPGGVISAPVILSGAAEDYCATAAALLPAGSLNGWRIVLDTANGATCATSPARVCAGSGRW
jgi:hypothetical protein